MRKTTTKKVEVDKTDTFGLPLPAKRELDRLLKQYNASGKGLPPKVVVKAARNPKSALHKYFTWDDSQAAEKQRLHEARKLLNRYKIIVFTPEPQTLRFAQRRKIAEEGSPKNGYYGTEAVIKSPVLWKNAKLEAILALRNAQAKLLVLEKAEKNLPAYLVRVQKAIKEALEKIV